MYLCAFSILGSVLDSVKVENLSCIFNLAQLVSLRVALPAELVLLFQIKKGNVKFRIAISQSLLKM